VLDDGRARRQQTLRVGVTLRVRQVADDVDQDLVRRLEAERCRVADVELDDPASLFLEPLCLFEYRTADVVKDVLELAGLRQVHSEQR
jgi:hypothetical protein